MTLKQRVNSFLDKIPRYSFNKLAQTLDRVNEQEKSRRSLIDQSYIEQVDKVIDQPQPYKLLQQYSNGHPFLRIVHGAVVTEVIGKGWEVKERFAKKCTSCGREYKNPVDYCEDCEPDYKQKKEEFEAKQQQREAQNQLEQRQPPFQKTGITPPDFQASALLRDPNPQEKTRLQSFIDEPNRDDELVDILKSVLKDHCACDDWYISIGKITGTQVTIYAEDASEMFICADKHGRLGNGVYFCPECWNSETNDYTQTHAGTCPRCGGEMKETAYVQKQQGKSTILTRFAKEEIIHGNGDPWLPKLYGNSKVPSILTELRTAYAMGQFNFRLYSKGRLGKIIGLKGETQDVASNIAQSVKTQKEKVVLDSYTGQVTREPVLDLFLGVKEGMEAIDVMPDAEKMRSLELLEWMLVKIVGAVYGVQPIMINQQTSPTGYHERMSVSVDQDRTRERQKMIEDALNEQLVVNVLKIRDWTFAFNEIEGRNELEEAQIWLNKVRAGKEAVNAGLDAEITEEGELKIMGKFQKQQPVQPIANQNGNQLPKEGNPEQPQAFNPTKSKN